MCSLTDADTLAASATPLKVSCALKKLGEGAEAVPPKHWRSWSRTASTAPHPHARRSSRAVQSKPPATAQPMQRRSRRPWTGAARSASCGTFTSADLSSRCWSTRRACCCRLRDSRPGAGQARGPRKLSRHDCPPIVQALHRLGCGSAWSRRPPSTLRLCPIFYPVGVLNSLVINAFSDSRFDVAMLIPRLLRWKSFRVWARHGGLWGLKLSCLPKELGDVRELR